MEVEKNDSTALPTFIDLLALANSLKRNGRHGTLKKMLIQAWRAQSCLGDLTQARYCCDKLLGLRPEATGPRNPADHAIEKSLLTTAVLLYARATHTSGKGEERGSITLQRGQLTPKQWTDHQELIELRNQVVAHVNPEHSTDERVWHKRLLFAVRHSSGRWRMASASNETSFHLGTFRRLQSMLPVAHDIVLTQFNRRISAANAQINQLELSDTFFSEMVFDPVEEFGSFAAVQRVLAGSGEQTDSFWYNE